MTDDYTHKKGIVYKNQFHIIFCPNDIAEQKICS